MWWHEQSWPQVEQLDRQIPVVIPLGSVEQHGLHLPLVVDTLQVTAIAQRVEAAMRDSVLVLPTLWLGCSEHHKDFPGTVSVPASLYSEMIKSIARSIIRAGFTRLLFLNGHGGNEVPAAQALTELVGEDDRADSCHLALSSWWQIARDSIAPARHGMKTAAISHACEYETSLLLALEPRLVRMQQIDPTAVGPDVPWRREGFGTKARVFHRFHRLTPTGSLGHPGAATAEKGRSLLDAVVGDTVEFLREFARWPDLQPRTFPRKSTG